MRHLLTGLVITAVTTAMPPFALADNQEIADEIAMNLRNSDRMSGYQIGVKYQEGTAWLRGRVRNQEQMSIALRMAFETDGVTRVVNGLTTGSPGKAAPVHEASQSGATQSAGTAKGPQRRPSLARRLEMAIAGGKRVPARLTATKPATGRGSGRAQRVPSSFRQQPARAAVAIEPQVARQVAPRATSANVPGRPIPVAYMRSAGGAPGGPIPAYVAAAGGGVAPARYDQPHLPNHSWPSYAAYPNYAALTYPRQYSPTAWPFIGPFYPYPQVPLGWRKVTLEWDDGWWMLDFKD